MIFMIICCCGFTVAFGLRPWIWRCCTKPVTATMAMSTRNGEACRMPCWRALLALSDRSMPNASIVVDVERFWYIFVDGLIQAGSNTRTRSGGFDGVTPGRNWPEAQPAPEPRSLTRRVRPRSTW